jgi:hypothetical protein
VSLNEFDRRVLSGATQWCNRCGCVSHHSETCLIPVIAELMAALKTVCEVDRENAIDYVYDPERCGDAFADAHALVAKIGGEDPGNVPCGCYHHAGHRDTCDLHCPACMGGKKRSG